MNLDFHCHGKLAKYLPLSTDYTNWIIKEAKNSVLDGICLTEHFNTKGFNELYSYINENSQRDGDTLIYNDFRIFPGMEVDIKEVGHTLVLGTIEDIMELNNRLEDYKDPSNFLAFDDLVALLSDYEVLFGAAHPFRKGGIPSLSMDQLSHFDFIDLNGKDLANNYEETMEKTKSLANKLNIPMITGSDTHQALQFGVVWTEFDKEINNFKDLYDNMVNENFTIHIADSLNIQVKSAKLLKIALKEIHALGGDYVKILVEEKNGFELSD